MGRGPDAEATLPTAKIGANTWIAVEAWNWSSPGRVELALRHGHMVWERKATILDDLTVPKEGIECGWDCIIFSVEVGVGLDWALCHLVPALSEWWVKSHLWAVQKQKWLLMLLSYGCGSLAGTMHSIHHQLGGKNLQWHFILFRAVFSLATGTCLENHLKANSRVSSDSSHLYLLTTFVNACSGAFFSNNELNRHTFQESN